MSGSTEYDFTSYDLYVTSLISMVFIITNFVGSFKRIMLPPWDLPPPEQGDEMDDPDMTSEEMLFEAVSRDRLHDVLILLKTGQCDINYRNSQQKTLLYLAIENGNTVMVNHLLEYGADINLKSYCGATCNFESPIITASRVHNAHIMDLLMSHGCNPSFTPNGEGKSALQWIASHGDINMALKLIEHKEDINWSGPYFHTALHYAVMQNHPEMLKWLLDNGATESINGDGRTALHLAAAKSFYECACILIDHNYSIVQEDNYAFTPFTLACLKGNTEMVNFMLNLMPRDNMFQSLIDDGLQRAADNGHVEVFHSLIWNKANVNATNKVGETPLILAARGHVEMTKLLLQQGALVNVVDNRGYMALQHAIQRGNIENALKLIYHGAALHSACPEVESPLKMAVNISNPILILYLLQAGLSLSKESWFNIKIVEEKIKEVEYKYPRNNICAPTQLKELWQSIITKMQCPPSLMEASRISVRQKMVEASRGSSIAVATSQLPLPKILQKYIDIDSIEY